MLLALLGGLTTSLVVLGIVQGATEFLPVSSSGHLVLAREWMGLESEGGLSREIALHFGTLLAVVLFCFRDLAAMLRGGSAALWRLVLGSMLVTGSLGLALRDVVEVHLNTTTAAGCGLLGTTVLLVLVAPSDDARQTRTLDQGSWRDAVVLGLFQTLALMPGISRAGATIVGALLLGFQRPDAVRVAFLMSIPVVGGAVLLDAVGGEGAEIAAEPGMAAAMALACLVGVGALRFIAVRVDARSLRLFGAYTFALGGAAILLG